MEMETLLHSNNINPLDLAASLVVETALCAQKSLLCLLLMIGSQGNGRNTLTSLMAAEQRFPFADLTSVRESVAENKDAGETDVTESDDDDEEDEDADNESDEEESDDGEDSDDDADANGDSGSDEDDDDNDEDDDSDDDEDDNDEDDDDEDDEDEQQPPPKKKK